MSLTWKFLGGLLVLPVAFGAAAGSAANPMASSIKTPTADRSSFAATGTLLDNTWGDDDTREDEKASKETGSWKADKDLGSLYSATKWYGANDAWSDSDSRGLKITGRGVDVAVIDTGVAPVAGLNATGKVVNGPDLSF